LKKKSNQNNEKPKRKPEDKVRKLKKDFLIRLYCSARDNDICHGSDEFNGLGVIKSILRLAERDMANLDFIHLIEYGYESVEFGVGLDWRPETHIRKTMSAIYDRKLSENISEARHMSTAIINRLSDNDYIEKEEDKVHAYIYINLEHEDLNNMLNNLYESNPSTDTIPYEVQAYIDLSDMENKRLKLMEQIDDALIKKKPRVFKKLSKEYSALLNEMKELEGFLEPNLLKK